MSQTIFIGQLDRKIKLFTQTFVRNEIGEAKPEEELLCSPWAMFEDLAGNTSEFVEGKVSFIMDAAFTVRFRATIKEAGNKLILEHDGRKFNVKHCSEIGRREYLKLSCSNYE